MKINKVINTKATEKVKGIISQKERFLWLGRDIETQNRTFGNHLKVRQVINDNMHILLSANSIIISVVLALLVKSSDQTYYLIYPAVFLLSVLLITICFLGEALAEKSRRLDIGYKVFIFGLIASLLALGLRFF